MQNRHLPPVPSVFLFRHDYFLTIQLLRVSKSNTSNNHITRPDYPPIRCPSGVPKFCRRLSSQSLKLVG
jgi:hypothetical protein